VNLYVNVDDTVELHFTLRVRHARGCQSSGSQRCGETCCLKFHLEHLLERVKLRGLRCDQTHQRTNTNFSCHGMLAPAGRWERILLNLRYLVPVVVLP